MSCDLSGVAPATNLVLERHPAGHGIAGEQQGEKRQYLPYDLKWDCPHCGSAQVDDFSNEYLGYPPLDRPFDHSVYCSACDKNSWVRFRLSFVLELVPSPPVA